MADDLFCQTCGYNLRGLTSDRCPECGRSLESLRADQPRIPWVHRKQIGLLRAYWKTVITASFRQGLFCEELARPVSLREAQKFRCITILLAYVPVLIVTLGAYVLFPPGALQYQPAPGNPFMQAGQFYTGPHPFMIIYHEIWPMALLHCCFLLWLIAVTGVSSYFFHPRDVPVELQNRAVALSYYGGAALAWMFIAVVLMVPGVVLLETGYEKLGTGVFLSGFFLAAAIIFVCVRDTAGLLRRIFPMHSRRIWAVRTSLLILWLGLGAVLFVGVPLVVVYVAVVFVSLA